MIKNILKFLLDVASIPVIIIIAYALKFKMGFIYNVMFDVDTGFIYNHAQIEPYLEHIVLVISIWIISFYLSKVYQRYYGIFAGINEVLNIVKGITAAIGILFMVSIIFEILPQSKSVLVYGWGLGIFLMSGHRVIINHYIPEKSKKKCIIVGAKAEAQDITERILHHFQGVYEYCGTIAETCPKDIKFTIKDKFNYIGNYKALEQILLNQHIECVFVNASEYDEKSIDTLIFYCEAQKIQIFLNYSISSPLQGVASYEDLSGIPLIGFKEVMLSKKSLILKRVFDLVIAFVGLIMLTPLFIGLSIWIKSVSLKGPVFYCQKRVGLNNKEFLMIKFRTMKEDAEDKKGPTWVSKHDTRYIKGGEWIRKFSLDELPQLINVLGNSMSLIGPRPERPFFVDKISQDAPYFSMRHAIKGGITGWAQIHGRAFLTTRPLEKFKYDLYYIKNWSWMLDLKILIKTIVIVLKGEEAY
ncbi:hypothetical protein DID78_05085 [Candidatus Marinamargulisbacteria bacterium SCGC AG-343-D04]|nr:hypothetical protein DID78_05085 [Candidatus Marinamargulisbacteria bacterium SCGC AG-343-D04]